MNFYVYWYFTIYVIYQRFSRDSQFDIFATGFFSLLASCLVIGGFAMMLFAFGGQESSIVTPERGAGGFVFIGIINYALFLPKQRQRRLYQKYKENQTTSRDIFTIFLSFVSIALFIFAVRLDKFNL